MAKMVVIKNGQIISERNSPSCSPSTKNRRNSFQELSMQMQQEQERKDQLYQQYMQTVATGSADGSPLNSSSDSIFAGDSPAAASTYLCAHCGNDPTGKVGQMGWRDRFSQTTLVFGFHLRLAYLLLVMGSSLFFFGLQGLMISLLVVYLGTVYSSTPTPAASVETEPAAVIIPSPVLKHPLTTAENAIKEQDEGPYTSPSLSRPSYLNGPAAAAFTQRRNSFAGPGFRLDGSQNGFATCQESM